MLKRTNLLLVVALFCTLSQAVMSPADEPKTGETRDTLLYVRTVPAGAKVFLDGNELGKSGELFHVEPGESEIVVELDGFELGSKQVTIRANVVTRVELTLKAQPGAKEEASSKPVEPPSLAPGRTVKESESSSPAVPPAVDTSKVVEGVGWGACLVGATREELIKAFGPLETTPGSRRTGWATHYHIDCWFDQAGHVVELRFMKGFRFPLTSGVRIGTPERIVLAAYGNPDRVVNEPKSKMLEWGTRGVLLWIKDGKVYDFTVFKPHGEPATAPNPGTTPPSAAGGGKPVEIASPGGTGEEIPSSDPIVEGIGWKSARVGATREAIIDALGKPDNDPSSDWLKWPKKHIECSFHTGEVVVSEVRFDPGFPAALRNGLKVGSPASTIVNLYGEPNVAYSRPNGATHNEYTNEGICFWTYQGKITQIICFKPYSPAAKTSHGQRNQ
jgi:hypothetical protein